MTSCDKLQSLLKVMHVECSGLEVKVTFVSSIFDDQFGVDTTNSTDSCANVYKQTALSTMCRTLVLLARRVYLR